MKKASTNKQIKTEDVFNDVANKSISQRLSEDDSNVFDAEHITYTKSTFNAVEFGDRLVMDGRLSMSARIIGIQLQVKFKKYGKTTVSIEALANLNGISNKECAIELDNLVRLGYLMISHYRGFTYEYTLGMWPEPFEATGLGENIIDFRSRRRPR